MLIRFLTKRVATLAALAVAVAFFVIGGAQWALPLGILLGVFLAVYKARLTQLMLAGAARERYPVRNVLTQLFAQLFTLGFLTVAALADIYLFAGGAIGLVLLPIFICVNTATERLGLTHNAWGEAAPGGEGG